MKKIVFFAFQGEEMCFMHLLLNALDMHNKGIDVGIVMEGKATALIKDLVENKNELFKKVTDLNLIDSVCKACANKMGVLQFVEENTQFTIVGDLQGHPPMEPYIKNGYEIITL